MRRADKEWSKWVATRPAVIQEAIRRWPIGTRVEMHGRVFYLLGWQGNEDDAIEDVRLILSPIDPFVDFDAAKQEKVYVCAHHVPEVQ